MRILMIKEKLKVTNVILDELVMVAKKYGKEMNYEILDYTTDLNIDREEEVCILVDLSNLIKYPKVFSRYNSDSNFIVLIDSSDGMDIDKLKMLGATNSILYRDLTAKRLSYLIYNPRTERELEAYLKINKLEFGYMFTSNEEEGDNYISQVKAATSKRTMENINIVGIFSPMTTGKTTIATLLATALSNKRYKTLLIDTDAVKKDCIYYFGFNEAHYGKFSSSVNKQMLNRGDRSFKEYMGSFIKISNKLYLASDHRDLDYELKSDDIGAIINTSGIHNIIIDISSNYNAEELNRILRMCSIKYLVVDKNIATLNSVAKMLDLSVYNRSFDIILNKDTGSKGVSNRDIVKILDGKSQLNIKEIHSIGIDVRSIYVGLCKKTTAYGISDNLTRDIDYILQRISGDRKTRGIKGLFKRRS